MIHHLIAQPVLMKKAKEELNRIVVQPYLKENPDFKGSNVMEKAITYENIWELQFFT